MSNERELTQPEKPANEHYIIPAPVLAATLDVLSQLPYKNVGHLIPALQQLQKAE